MHFVLITNKGKFENITLCLVLAIMSRQKPWSQQTQLPEKIKLYNCLRGSLCKNLMTSLDQETDSSQTL